MGKLQEQIAVTNTCQISSGTTIKGEITSKDPLRIDGEVEGSLNVNKKIVVGQEGRIKGNISCGEMLVSGKIHGDIKTDSLLSLKSTAVVEADITVGQIIIELGARFNGNCSMASSKIESSQK